ncbi:hypothetical protein Tco_0731550 [Tanacetum coccineum]
MPRGTTQVVTRGASNDWCQMCRYEVRGGRASVRGTVAVRGVSTRQYEYEELYKDVNVRLKDTEHEEEGKEDAKMTDTEVPLQSSSISFDFANQFLNLDNVPPTDSEVVSMMNVKVRHEEPSTQTPSLLNVPVTVIPETSIAFGPTIPSIISPITPLPQQSTPTPTPAPTIAMTTTLIPALPDFSSLFGFDQRVSALEKKLSQFKQADYSAQLLETIKSQIPAMVDAQLSTRIEDSIQNAFRSYTAEFEKKDKDEKKRYIDLVEKSVKDIIKVEFKSQLPQILPKKVSDYATPVIQNTITESLKNVVLEKSSSQPKSTYEAAASLTEFELKKILLDKMHKTYSLKRDCEDKDKDEDPPAGSDQGLKKRKTSKDVEPSKGSKSKESKSSLSKGTKSQSKSYGKSAQAEESVFETADTIIKSGGPFNESRRISTTESDKVIKSSVENLVPIPSESEGILDNMCDVPLCNNPTPLEAFKEHSKTIIDSNNDSSSSDDNSYENINYVDASPPDVEIVSLKAVEIVIP